MKTINLTEQGAQKIIKGEKGMTFVVDVEIPSLGDNKKIIHIRDYRFLDSFGHFAIWALVPEDYEVVKE